MSVDIIPSNGGEVVGCSNGEWAAICAMGAEFNICPRWNGNHDCGVEYSSSDLRMLAKRARQIGSAAEYLDALADSGGATIS